MKTTVEIIKSEDKRSYDIKVTTPKSLTGAFYIPVIDVRDGDKEREIANTILKASKVSKFFKPTFASGGGSYQVSRKQKQ